jgi:hypothetical protein
MQKDLCRSIAQFLRECIGDLVRIENPFLATWAFVGTNPVTAVKGLCVQGVATENGSRLPGLQRTSIPSTLLRHLRRSKSSSALSTSDL